MTDPTIARRCAKVLHAIGEPSRICIIDILRTSPTCVGDIAAALKVRMVNITHHLRVLGEAGLVESEKQGRRVIYSLTNTFRKNTLELGWCKLTIIE